MPLVGVTEKATPVQEFTLMAVIAGVGFTTMVNVCAVPLHVLETGVTVMDAVTETFELLTAVKAAIFPVPEAASPIEGKLFVQLNTVLATGEPAKITAPVKEPLHTT